MWLKLGESELLNIDTVASIKKAEVDSIHLIFKDGQQKRVLPFPREQDRDLAFHRILRALQERGLAIE